MAPQALQQLTPEKNRELCLIVDGSCLLPGIGTHPPGYGALQASELSVSSSGQAQELTGCPLPSMIHSEGRVASVSDKSTTLVGRATPAASSLVTAGPTKRLQGEIVPTRNSRSSGEPSMMEHMQPLQRSKSDPAMYVRPRQDMVKGRAEDQMHQDEQCPPMASFAARSVLSMNNSDVPESLTGVTASMTVVQPDWRSLGGHASSKVVYMGSSPKQNLHNDADEKSSMNSESRPALMPLLQDLAFAVMAAEQSGNLPLKFCKEGSNTLGFVGNA